SNQFKNLYLPVIKKFSEFVQEIPFMQPGFFNHKINFLERGLERSARSLSLCLNYFFPEKNNLMGLSCRDDLSLYATFTAALFLDVGQLVVEYNTVLYNKKSYPLKNWSPFTGSMLGLGYYYKTDFIKENYNNLQPLITPILARQILECAYPCSLETEGFHWIASDLKILEMWLHLLSGNEDRIPMTSFMSMVPRAEIELIEHSRLSAQIETTEPSGEAFLQWLRKEIADEKILINEKEAKINIADGKILISTELFQEFATINPNYKHPEVIEKQFIDVAKLYQISISELDQRYRALGGLSGMGDLSKRYRTVGGISTAIENQKKPFPRVLQGDIRLISLITSCHSLQKMININSFQDITKKFTSPHLT
ncbi:conjugal transfer nickase/helicase domain-containing protein, partial [Rickettsiella grylli]|uniref:conjugal transfer nickase/helicase domain-containing protein n=1 Tax=Rickettsiella grylli TaxID=59196 RepID=UPI000A3F26BA